jgi:hypothetical protein
VFCRDVRFDESQSIISSQVNNAEVPVSVLESMPNLPTIWPTREITEDVGDSESEVNLDSDTSDDDGFEPTEQPVQPPHHQVNILSTLRMEQLGRQSKPPSKFSESVYQATMPIPRSASEALKDPR